MPVPQWLDLSAVFVGAIAGVLVSKQHKLDLVGFIGMCLICALGGGLLRDAIMQAGSVYALESRWPIPLCVITAVVGFFFPSVAEQFPRLYEWVDMISVALFVIAGTDKAILHNLYLSGIILMGTITGVGGGMLRDVFLGEVPQVFRKSNFYALCAIMGAIAYYVCKCVIGLDQTVSSATTVAVVVLLRQASLHFDITTPADVDLTPKVVETGRRVAEDVKAHACEAIKKK
ncbi:MAG: TRIC cation channel family protein [Coriobacteriales bacterium]|nr:TRIC cation channel family protein [Coriobacteriales bacterium]